MEDRHEEHKNDSFVIKVPADGSLLHSDHTATCSRGAHPMFVAAARDCPEMFDWSRNQIKNFIAQRHIADPVETLAHRIKKSNESARRGMLVLTVTLVGAYHVVELIKIIMKFKLAELLCAAQFKP